MTPFEQLQTMHGQTARVTIEGRVDHREPVGGRDVVRLITPSAALAYFTDEHVIAVELVKPTPQAGDVWWSEELDTTIHVLGANQLYVAKSGRELDNLPEDAVLVLRSGKAVEQ